MKLQTVLAGAALVLGLAGALATPALADNYSVASSTATVHNPPPPPPPPAPPPRVASCACVRG
jgi:hypothetical protein